MLTFSWIKQGEVIIVGDLLVWLYVTQSKQRHTELAIDRPLLHLAVWLT